MDILEKRYQDLQRAALVAHCDANETLFLERELTQLRQKLFEVVYPALIARSFAPKAGDIAASAETYSFKVYRQVGKASHKGYDADDHTKTDANATEAYGVVRPITDGYGWNINELREAARTGVQLSEMKARAARDVIERGIDMTLAYGAIPNDDGTLPNIGLNGLVNNVVVDDSIEAGLFWLNPTPVDPSLILKDLNDWVSKIGQQSKQAFEADSIILPKTHFDYAEQTPFSELTGESILTIFQKNNKRIKSVAPWHLLDSVTAALGGQAKPRGIAYKKDPMVLEAVIPQEFEALPPEVRKFRFEILCHARCGGVKIYQPLAVRYIDFATS